MWLNVEIHFMYSNHLEDASETCDPNSSGVPPDVVVMTKRVGNGK